MRLLLFEWNGLMQRDLENELNKLHIMFRRLSYAFRNIHEDEFFETRFRRHMIRNSYDAVISFNFFPLVAKICYEQNIKYIAWCYDSPIRVIPFDTFAIPTNYIFMFDKKEAQEYRKKGFDTVYHMPLAVSSQRMEHVEITTEDYQKYKRDISFVGNFHHSNYEEFLAPLPEYFRGYLNAIKDIQLDMRELYFPDVLFTDDLMEKLNFYYKEYTGNQDYCLSKENLSFLFGKYITERERIKYLKVFSNYFKVKLYSNRVPEQLKEIEYGGTVRYDSDMGKVFALSSINFNSSFYCIRTGISLRILDILGAGGFLLTNYQAELEEYFRDGQELVFYQDIYDAVEKCRYYLQHEEQRKTIAEHGQEKVFEHFSYQKQLGHIFDIAGIG